MSVTQPLLRTSSAPIHDLPVRHVMIEVPAVKLPDFKPDLGIAAGSDRSKRFYSPILGTVDAFVEINLPENRLFNVQYIKPVLAHNYVMVWPTIKAALTLKTGLNVEWMCREQAVGKESESEFLRLLEQLQLGNQEGLVIKTTNNSHVIVSQTKDGDTQLFLTRSADLHVGQVVHFLPIYGCFDAPVHFAADCRAVQDGRLLPMKGDTNQFRIAGEEIELVDAR